MPPAMTMGMVLRMYLISLLFDIDLAQDVPFRQLQHRGVGRGGSGTPPVKFRLLQAGS